MKLSYIVATKNRASALIPCLDSISAAVAKAAALDTEIVIADNGSTDNTPQIIQAYARKSSIPVQSLAEPYSGKARALNCALRAARGELLAFTDDDCRLHPDHVNDLLRHAATDTELVLRGGRIELGDPTDLPFTINTKSARMQWSRRQNSARDQPITGEINGCNMTMRRAVLDKLGPLDERFGPGSIIGSGDDTDYIFRAYIAGMILEYVPDMAVSHFHGRKTAEQGRKLFERYLTGSGGLTAKYILKHPNLCRPFYWDIKNALRETITATNLFLPSIGFSYRDKVACSVRGAMRYFIFAARRPATT